MTKMDSTKDRFFVRFNSKKSTQAAVNQELPLCKKRTVLRLFFQLLLGDFDYMEVYNEGYLNKKSFTKEKVDGVTVRGKGKTMRAKMHGEFFDDSVRKFEEGLYDPETREGYECVNQTIKPFDEEGLDNCMSLIEYINDEVM